jgi:D-alanine--poly(phosphoribitol) ligase subunit 1
VPLDLLGQIGEWGRRAPDRAAHRSGDRTLSYQELCDRSDALAEYLERSLPGSDAPIALVGHKEPELLIGFLGCAKAGRAYVPLDTSLPTARMERMLATGQPALVLTPEDVALHSRGAARPAAIPVHRDALHYIMFTSGSTGDPKGVPITRGNLEHFLEGVLAEHPFRPAAEVFLNQALFSFDLSHMDTYLSLLTGGTLVSLSREDSANPRRLFQVLAESGLTVWVSTPTFAAMCLVERRFDQRMLPALRRFLFCGEVLPAKTAAALLDRFPEAELWNTYGPTETTIAATSIRIDRAVLGRYPTVPIGYALHGTRVLTVDEWYAVVPPGQRGEILIVGPSVSPGYLHRPDLTVKSFMPFEGERAYRTGDWGHTQDGVLFWDGRMDDQIKLHGHRIELGDIEAHLCALPGVLGAAVLPVRNGDQVESLMAHVLLAEESPPSDSERAATLREALRERLPAHMIPKHFRFVSAFPLTPNGKIDRRRLTGLPIR